MITNRITFAIIRLSVLLTEIGRVFLAVKEPSLGKKNRLEWLKELLQWPVAEM